MNNWIKEATFFNRCQQCVYIYLLHRYLQIKFQSCQYAQDKLIWLLSTFKYLGQLNKDANKIKKESDNDPDQEEIVQQVDKTYTKVADIGTWKVFQQSGLEYRLSLCLTWFTIKLVCSIGINTFRVFIASLFTIEVSIRRQGQRKVIAIVGYNQVFESIVRLLY